ncbi:hypothetical protein R3P38DRAFT_3096473 [Favolaschia claudopus]|uniref:Uncharacterized protein n=1 Tax=Favolaschia claudopus TaxID=2862362 RepID=A0AAV9ZPA4_9AGAR
MAILLLTSWTVPMAILEVLECTLFQFLLPLYCLSQWDSQQLPLGRSGVPYSLIVIFHLFPGSYLSGVIFLCSRSN